MAPKIPVTTQEHADYFEKGIARLRLIARDAAVTSGLWIRSWHGTPDSLAGIDREGKRIESGEISPYLAWIAFGGV